MDDIKKKRIIGIIIVVLGLALLIAIIYFLFFYNFSAPAPSNNKEAQGIPKQQGGPNLPSNPKAVINVGERTPLTKSEVTEAELKRLAASFAERFGSFSNQSPIANILDLKVFMTSKMQAWADKYIEDLNANKSDSSIFN